MTLLGSKVNVSRAMPTNVLMPQLGESIAEGTIVRWNKQVGDSVVQEEPLFEVSTDKVDAEIPSPAAGVITKILAAEGDTVLVDTVVALIGEREDVEVTESDDDGSPADPTSERLLDSDNVKSEPVQTEERNQAVSHGFSPVVRKLAAEHQIDPNTISGTGTGGRVTKTDVLRAVREMESVSGRVEPMTAMRSRIAERMVESRRTSAHVHTVFDVDFSRVSELRVLHRSTYEEAGHKLSYLVFVAKAVVEALQEVPIVNASMDGSNIVYRADVNLAIAVALDWGLIAPVIRNAHTKSVVELSRSIGDLSNRARSKQLQPEEVVGGTFTVTNPGVFGSILGMPIINQPQLAILCMGAVEVRPVVVNGEVVAQPRSYLTLAFDHRIIDGAVADRFMSRVKEHLEKFEESLL